MNNLTFRREHDGLAARTLVSDGRARLSGMMHGIARLEIGRSPIAVALAMFAIVFVVRLSVEDATSGVSLLYSIPIVLLTVAYGARGGLAGATLAFVLVVVWTVMSDVHLGAAAFVVRGLGFYAVPCTMWLARPNLAAAEIAPAPEAARIPEPAEEQASPHPLTPRESEVLGLLAAGNTNAQIADRLVLSVRTVESHRANLQRKLGRPDRTELVQYALQLGLTGYNGRIPF